MKISDKALELIIRDVLGGMEEMATMEGYATSLAGMEILGIEPNDPGHSGGQHPESEKPRNAVVLPFPGLRKTA